MPYRPLQEWLATETYEGLREAALAHLWMPMRQWNDVAAEGGLRVIVGGERREGEGPHDGGKGITSGYQPVGAVIARAHVAEAFKGGPEQTFSHGFTFSGHPAGAVAALVNLEIIERERLVENAARMGEYLLGRLLTLRERPAVGDVQGLGFMCSVELLADKRAGRRLSEVPGAEARLTARLQELGLLTRLMAGRLFLCPPLTVSRADVDAMVDIVAEALASLEQEVGATPGG